MKIGENRDSSGRNVTAVFKTDGIGRNTKKRTTSALSTKRAGAKDDYRQRPSNQKESGSSDEPEREERQAAV